MIRLMLIVFFVGMTTPALADTGTDWFAAMQKRKTKTAVALTVPGGLKYGNTGKDQVVNATSTRVEGLTPWTEYTFRVNAVDGAGNTSAGGLSVTVHTTDGGGAATVRVIDNAPRRRLRGRLSNLT